LLSDNDSQNINTYTKEVINTEHSLHITSIIFSAVAHYVPLSHSILSVFVSQPILLICGAFSNLKVSNLPSLLPAAAILTLWNSTRRPVTHRTGHHRKVQRMAPCTSVCSTQVAEPRLHLPSLLEELAVQSPAPANVASTGSLLTPADSW